MSQRSIAVPAQTKQESICQIEEIVRHGIIRVLVAHSLVDASGALMAQEQYETIVIDGERYKALVADKPPAWAKTKPKGTYRNDDLWHFIDEVREEAKKPKEAPVEMIGGTRASK